MTEQEAQALAARLTRIWQPLPVKVSRGHRDRKGHLDWDTELRCRLGREGNFDWDADLLGRGLGHTRHTIRIGVSFYADASEPPTFEWRCDWEGKTLLATLSVTEERDVEQSLWWATPGVKREFTKRTLGHWTPLFRRNCWLSGGPIECSAHEKAEWIQGITKEEIEAWKLKM